MRVGFVGLLLTVGMTGSAMAADVVIPMSPATQPFERGGWQIIVAPYLWISGLDGNMAQFGAPSVSVHENFGDIIKDVNIGFMSMAEARNGDFSIFNDLQYSKVSSGGTTPLGVLATGVNVTSKTFSGLLGAGYTLARSDAGFIDVAAGARIWSVHTDLSFNGGLLDGLSVSDGDTWVDGLIGVRGNFNFTPQLYLTGWGLVGAGQADLDWDVAAGLGYHFNDKYSSIIGYRALGVDYSNSDGFVFDIIQHGPIFGLVAKF